MSKGILTKSPSHGDQEKYFEIRSLGKSGNTLSKQQVHWLEKFYADYPDWTDEAHTEVYNRTRPLGAPEK